MEGKLMAKISELLPGNIVNIIYKEWNYNNGDNVSIEGNAHTNVELGGNYKFDFEKKHKNSLILIESCLHVLYGGDNDAANVWSGGTNIVYINGSSVSGPNSYAEYGLGHNSTTTDSKGRSMGYVTSNIVIDNLDKGQINFSQCFRPTYGQESDEYNYIHKYGSGYVKIMEVLL
jgi:hypothetical protein